jgi:hypothetical protein
MGHVNPFSISTFQELYNVIRKFLIQWVLAPTFGLWRFGNPSGLQFPKWELTSECGNSFSHTLLHSRKHEMWLSGFTLGPHLCKLLPCHEPKAKVVTFSPTRRKRSMSSLTLRNYFFNAITFIWILGHWLPPLTARPCLKLTYMSPSF